MTNPVKGEAALILSDGRELTLVFSSGALIHAEVLCGKPTAQIMVEASKGFLGATSALLCGALQKFHKDITLEEAADIALTEGQRVREAIDRAAELAFPDADKAEKTEGKESVNPPGNSSGPSGAKRTSTQTPSSKQPLVPST